MAHNYEIGHKGNLQETNVAGMFSNIDEDVSQKTLVSRGSFGILSLPMSTGRAANTTLFIYIRATK